MNTGTRTIAVCGATGRQGGALARHALERGWHVRALTRRADRPPAKELAARGAEVVVADMDDPATLRAAFEGVDGVFSVQNGLVNGFEREVAQGKAVADAAAAAGVSHLVYASAGLGRRDTGVPSWNAKVEVEDHLATLDVPTTVLRPMAFMELMTDKAFYPAVGTWRIWPRLMGDDRPVVWLAVDDLGAIAAQVFSQPDQFAGQVLTLAADVVSLAECRDAYREIVGRPPRTVPMPEWLLDRFTRKDVTTMWRWLRTGEYPLDVAPTRALLPSALTVRAWLERTVGPRATDQTNT